jgi:pimeloyl-ACP methyl ester carboxylesterase
MSFASTRDGERIYFESHGAGPAVMLGPPVCPSSENMPFPPVPPQGFVEGLTDRYRVVVMDYPGVGKSDAVRAGDLTAERVADDLLRVADAAGSDRFCWWGYSWGGAVGLQLATRSDRVAALVCGGYPPLGEFHLGYVDVIRGLPGAESHVTFYDSLAGWPEAAALEAISCPRLLYFGSDDEFVQSDTKVTIAATARSHRDELIAQGWRVVEVPGRDHSLGWDLEVVIPLVRAFLDELPPW